jgi:hypothetical protein
MDGLVSPALPLPTGQWYAAAEAARIMSADKTTDAKSVSVLDGCVSAIEDSIVLADMLGSCISGKWHTCRYI